MGRLLVLIVIIRLTINLTLELNLQRMRHQNKLDRLPSASFFQADLAMKAGCLPMWRGALLSIIELA